MDGGRLAGFGSMGTNSRACKYNFGEAKVKAGSERDDGGLLANDLGCERGGL
ncbi:hypothetical protein VDG1235_4221 [Verrucomicrobiia bacterium DG1235]|nr:hypothetical protein VDG1235_4221 [Verrucomicrobiae bacterium DG1235]